MFTTADGSTNHREESSLEKEEEENDFRCIAVEINEERFAVDLVSPSPLSKPPELKSSSPPKGLLPKTLLVE